jgi:hypothetical protein
MKAEHLSASLAFGVGAWLLFLALFTGCWAALLLIMLAIVLAWVVDDGER